jgi:hypothetical protein
MPTEYSKTQQLKTALLKADEIKVLSTGDASIAGQATLGGGGGMITINTKAVASNSCIIATGREPITGFLYASNIINGTSFDIISSAGAADDGKKISWLIINTY